LTQSKVEQWIQGQNFDLLVASHDGYQHGEQPVIHRRWIVSLKNGIYLIRDVVDGQGRHRLDVAWHLGQDLQLVGEGVFRVKGAAHGVALIPAHGHGWAEEVSRESWSPAYGEKAPATVVNFGADLALPSEFAVLLVTLEEAHDGPRSFARIEDAVSSDVQGYKYVAEGTERSFFFGKRGQAWRKDGLLSDAEFVFRETKPGSADEHLVFCGGSFAQVERGAELRCIRSVQWAEIVLTGGSRAVFSSEMAAVEHKYSEAHQHETAPGSSE